MIYFIIVALFSAYVIFECLSVLPRVAGAIIGSNALGYTFSVMMGTIKRVFIVSYPPLLGWLAMSGESLYSVIFASYFFGGIGATVVILIRNRLVGGFIGVLRNYSSGANLFHSFSLFKIGFRDPEDPSPDGDSLKQGQNIICIKLAFSSAWIYFVYGSSLFFINLIGSIYSDYSAIIYQSIGIVNALGTLLMSFFLDPKISRNFDRKMNIKLTMNSILTGQIVSVVVLGPIFIFAFWLSKNLFN
jgi:hypothetical protein